MPYQTYTQAVLKEITPAGQQALMVLGLAVINWNTFETSIRKLLSTLVTGPTLETTPDPAPATILTVELGTRQIVEALKAFAHDILEGSQADAVAHSAAIFDRLIPYRNTYFHGFGAILPEPPDGGELKYFINDTAAKSKISQWNTAVSIEELLVFITWCSSASTYTLMLDFCMVTDGKLDTLIEKPSLPPALTKTRRLWRERTRQPQS